VDLEFISYFRHMCLPYVKARFTKDMDERGASLVEYALLVALIAVVCIIAVTTLGSNASKKLSKVGSAIK
jgi:pilus assembly protein Flp/PilA